MMLIDFGFAFINLKFYATVVVYKTWNYFDFSKVFFKVFEFLTFKLHFSFMGFDIF